MTEPGLRIMGAASGAEDFWGRSLDRTRAFDDQPRRGRDPVDAHESGRQYGRESGRDFSRDRGSGHYRDYDRERKHRDSDMERRDDEPATVIGTIIPTIIVKSTTLTVAGYVLCPFYDFQFDAHNKKGANRNDRRRCYICNTPGHIAIRHNAWALTHQRHVAGSIGMTVREPQTR